MSVFVTNVASMIGIGVAVDYSLFVLARYREEVLAGAEPADARRTALRTSGLAVVFSGVTVMVSLAGLFLVPSTTIRSMALGAIVVVAVSILAAVTLLPVLMRLLGRRAYQRGRIALTAGVFVRNLRSIPAPPGLDASRAPARPDFWQRWTERVMRRPWLSAGASAACCSCSRSRRCRWSSATARCASSRRATRRASAPSWPRRSSARAPRHRPRCWPSSTAAPRPTPEQPRRAERLRRASCARDPEVAEVGRAAALARRRRGADRASCRATTPRARRRAR